MNNLTSQLTSTDDSSSWKLQWLRKLEGTVWILDR